MRVPETKRLPARYRRRPHPCRFLDSWALRLRAQASCCEGVNINDSIARGMANSPGGPEQKGRDRKPVSPLRLLESVARYYAKLAEQCG
jgi:hypothetical protein